MTEERSDSSRRVAVAVLTLVAVLLVPLNAQAADSEGAATHATDVATPEPTAEVGPSRFAVGFDAAVMRPIGFLALMVGCAAFVPAALITWPNGRDSVEMAAEIFVTSPANDVFGRKLGDF